MLYNAALVHFGNVIERSKMSTIDASNLMKVEGEVNSNVIDVLPILIEMGDDADRINTT
jgi:hypothetical protein